MYRRGGHLPISIKSLPLRERPRDFEDQELLSADIVGDKMNLTIHAEGKKKVNPLVIPGVCFTKLIINHLQSRHRFHKRPGSPLHMPYDEYALGYLKFSFKNTKRVRFGMTIPNTLITEDIRTASYYPEYVAKVAKYQRFLAGEEVSDDDAPPPKPAKGAKPKTTKKPTSTQQTKPKTKPLTAKTTKSTPSQPPKPKPAPAKPQEKKQKQALDAAEAPSQAKRSKAGRVSKKRTLQLRDEFIDEGVPATEPRVDDEEAIVQNVLEECMKEVQGKGKEKVGEEQAAGWESDVGSVLLRECIRSEEVPGMEQTLVMLACSQTKTNQFSCGFHAGPKLGSHDSGNR
ncbi:hypothetical protein Tco_0496214 [Tanacetum coccineum]